MTADGTTAKPAAYCTLVTNDGYVDGALTVAKSLRKTNTPHPIAILVTSAVSESSQSRLRALFDAVIPVDPISGLSHEKLALIGRPDLHATLTKLQLWSLSDLYSRVLYLDADTLILANLDHLFRLSGPAAAPFAAAPELGFPDCFNSGVMLLTPDAATYRSLRDFAAEHESFDGGDQGLLNQFWGDGTLGHPIKDALLDDGSKATHDGGGSSSSKRNWFRLSYTYNMEMHKVFRMYIPAVLRYQAEHKILHFIGKEKPWQFLDGEIETPQDASPYFKFYVEMVGKWWDIRRSVEV